MLYSCILWNISVHVGLQLSSSGKPPSFSLILWDISNKLLDMPNSASEHSKFFSIFCKRMCFYILVKRWLSNAAKLKYAAREWVRGKLRELYHEVRWGQNCLPNMEGGLPKRIVYIFLSFQLYFNQLRRIFRIKYRILRIFFISLCPVKFLNLFSNFINFSYFKNSGRGGHACIVSLLPALVYQDCVISLWLAACGHMPVSNSFHVGPR